MQTAAYNRQTSQLSYYKTLKHSSTRFASTLAVVENSMGSTRFASTLGSFLRISWGAGPCRRARKEGN